MLLKSLDILKRKTGWTPHWIRTQLKVAESKMQGKREYFLYRLEDVIAVEKSGVLPKPKKVRGSSLINGSDWSHDQTYEEYVDFSKEVVSFKDEGNSSVDLKLCFDMKERTAYMSITSYNDDGTVRELNDTEIKLTWEEGKRQLGEELGKFLENQVAVFRGLKIDPDSPLYRAMQGTVFAVEANTFEQRILYNAYKDEVKWVGDNSGYLPTIGHIDERPVCISVFWVEIDGRRILFYHPTSQAVDHKLIEEWLDANMPLNEYNGRKTRCDADNFHMCVGAIREMNSHG